jgi:hypothetical protein
MLFLERLHALLGAASDVAMHFVVFIAVIGVASCVADVVWEHAGRDIVASRSSALMCVVEVTVDNLISPALLLGLFNFDLTSRGESGASLIILLAIHLQFFDFSGG